MSFPAVTLISPPLLCSAAVLIVLLSCSRTSPADLTETVPAMPVLWDALLIVLLSCSKTSPLDLTETVPALPVLCDALLIVLCPFKVMSASDSKATVPPAPVLNDADWMEDLVSRDTLPAWILILPPFPGVDVA